VTRILWPTDYGKSADFSTEARVDALGEAIQLWPHSSLYQQRALIFQTLADTQDGPASREPSERAIADYQEAVRLHSMDPALAVNLGNRLSLAQRDAEAELCYARVIELQGGMERGFRGHFSFATHFLRKGSRLYRPDAPQAARAALELAAQQIEASVKDIRGSSTDMWEPRLAIHENLGFTREAAGDFPGAMEAYNFASTLGGGGRVHYRVGVLLGKMAVESWSKRRAPEALSGFTQARQRIGQAGDVLPPGVTPAQRAEYIAYLDRMIAFLVGAKIKPG
jgi:tetratricopeptide (TPR) repeat protein